MTDHGVTPPGQKKIPMTTAATKGTGLVSNGHRGVKQPSGWARWRASGGEARWKARKATSAPKTQKSKASSAAASREPAAAPSPGTAAHGVGSMPAAGVPYGEQLDKEKAEMNAMYKFRPAAGAKLRAATRKALGRG